MNSAPSLDQYRLSSEQLECFARDGFVVLPDRFTPNEVADINATLATLISEDRPENIREKSSGVVRTAMALHVRHERFADSSRTHASSCPRTRSSATPTCTRSR